jgi:hypothetical protein
VSATFDPARSAALEKPTSVHILSPAPRRRRRTPPPPRPWDAPPARPAVVNASRLSMIAPRVCVQGAVCATDLAGPFLGQPVFHVIFASCLTPPGLTFFLAVERRLAIPISICAVERSSPIDRDDGPLSPRARSVIHLFSTRFWFPFRISVVYVIQGFRWNDEIAEICASGCDARERCAL